MKVTISLELETHGTYEASCKEIELAEAHTKEFLAEEIAESYATGECCRGCERFDFVYWMQYPKSILVCIYASFVTEE